MLGELFACQPTLRLSNAPAKASWTSNARFNSKDKKRVLAKHAFRPRYLHTVTGDMLSKDATLATTKLSKIVGRPSSFDKLRTGRHTRSQATGTIHRTTNKVDLPMDRGRQGSSKSFLERGCLTSLWPLAVATPPMSVCKQLAPSVETQNITAVKDRVKCRAR
jgi:hypothetical protein